MDAARRMIASSQRTVERLGLTHRLLEAEADAGASTLEPQPATASASKTQLGSASSKGRKEVIVTLASKPSICASRPFVSATSVSDSSPP